MTSLTHIPAWSSGSKHFLPSYGYARVPSPVGWGFLAPVCLCQEWHLRLALPVLLAALLLCVAMEPGFAAQSPFGVALPDSNAPVGDGAFKGFFLWVSQQQSAFYKAMVEAVKAIKESGNATWYLAGLSFLYGVFHAAGPGHGKVVLSSYLLASNETARTGIIVSFIASMAQAVAAIGLIGIAAVVLNMTSIAITDTTALFETGSYALIAALGMFLVWKKVLRPLAAGLLSPSPAAAAHAGAGHAGHHHHHHHAHGHAHAHDHVHDDHCCHVTGAGTAQAIAASQTPVKDALAVIVAVGMRPCSGALIVLVFALSQGLFWAGILATFAMALGTGLVVAGLVVLSVFARDTAARLAGGGSRLAGRMLAALEGLAALFILFVGLTLLYASLLHPPLT